VKALGLKKELQTPTSPNTGRSSVNPVPKQLLKTHVRRFLHHSRRKNHKIHVQYVAKQKIKDGRLHSGVEFVSLCFDTCFKEFHTKVNL
jgi:hypothetical protein